MTFPAAVVEASYAHCRQVTRRAGSSFPAAFVFLQREKRQAMDAVYAFARHTDDLADSSEPAEYRGQQLADWRDGLLRAFAGHFGTSGGGEHLAILPAVADAAARFGIPAERFLAVIEGGQMDLGRRRFQTFDQLAHYCRLVASSVGLACLSVWGFEGDEALARADACGIAFQLTNILRDVREDALQDRCYLPLDELERFGCKEHALGEGKGGPAFRALMNFQLERARAYYGEARLLLNHLSPDGRRVCGFMMSVYGRLLERIASHPEEVLYRRVRLGRCQKAALLVRSLIGNGGGGAVR